MDFCADRTQRQSQRKQTKRPVYTPPIPYNMRMVLSVLVNDVCIYAVYEMLYGAYTISHPWAATQTAFVVHVNFATPETNSSSA